MENLYYRRYIVIIWFYKYKMNINQQSSPNRANIWGKGFPNSEVWLKMDKLKLKTKVDSNGYKYKL